MLQRVPLSLALYRARYQEEAEGRRSGGQEVGSRRIRHGFVRQSRQSVLTPKAMKEWSEHEEETVAEKVDMW